MSPQIVHVDMEISSKYIGSRGRPTRGVPPSWGLAEGLISLTVKTSLLRNVQFEFFRALLMNKTVSLDMASC